MSSSIVQCPDIIIPAGQTESNPVYADLVYDDASEIQIGTPHVLPGAVTYVVQVGYKNSREGTVAWTTLNDGTSDITVPADIDKTFSYPSFPAKVFRILASGSVGVADLVFKMQKRMVLQGR